MIPPLLCALLLAVPAYASPSEGKSAAKKANEDYAKRYQVYQQNYLDGVSREELHALLTASTQPDQRRLPDAISKAAHAAKYLALIAAADAAATKPGFRSPLAVNWLTTLHLESFLRAYPQLRRSFDFMDTLKWQYIALGQLGRAQALHRSIAAPLPAPVRQALSEDRPCYDFLLASFTIQSVSALDKGYQHCQHSRQASHFKTPAAKAWRFVSKAGRPFSRYDEYAKALSH